MKEVIKFEVSILIDYENRKGREDAIRMAKMGLSREDACGANLHGCFSTRFKKLVEVKGKP